MQYNLFKNMGINFQQVDCVFMYSDDILIFCDDSSSHIKNVETVLKILYANNLNITSKSIFDVTSVDFRIIILALKLLELHNIMVVYYRIVPFLSTIRIFDAYEFFIEN